MRLDDQNIADRIAIEERILLYAHYLDSLQFELLAAEVFTEDAVVDFGGTQARGRAAIHAQVMSYRDAMVGCSHNMSNMIIDVAGDDARASTRVIAWHWFTGDPDPFAPSQLVAVGGYEDRLRRQVDGWRIYERRGLSFGTGIGSGSVPEPMKPIWEQMWGRRPTFPA